MDETVAIGSRHVVVDLCDNVAGTLGGGQRGIHADAKAAITVGIGWGNLDQGNIDGHCTTLEQWFDLAQINRRIVGAAVIDGIPDIAPYEHCVVSKVSSHF